MASDDGGAAELREKVAIELACRDGYEDEWEDWQESTREAYRKDADRILLLTSADARRREREAFCDGAAYGWDHGYKRTETMSDAGAVALERYPEATP